jgi:uncharacterized protein (DUF2126 family)
MFGINETTETEIVDALRDLDARIQSLGLTIWVGGEPTFTDRFAATPEWISNALGGDKEAKAEDLLHHLVATIPGCVVLRSVGRQYPNEPIPRWSLGILSLRNGAELWHGPPDPKLYYGAHFTPYDPQHFRLALIEQLHTQGWSTLIVDSLITPTIRLLARWDGKEFFTHQIPQHQLYRPSIHAEALPDTGLNDELAQAGFALLTFTIFTNNTNDSLAIELPGLAFTDIYLQLITAIEITAIALQLPTLVLRGYPPPLDQQLLWQTITPDPAVIEVNQAPAANLVEQFHFNQALFKAASQCGLAPYRLHYNGREGDSGGGGQITIGGSTPTTSPFFLQPKLLPRLIRYFNHHPSLSYWFAMESLGSGSQAARPDEGPRERWLELAVALEQLELHDFVDPTFLWTSLAPLLVDAAVNSHRAELNIEKLWNPHIPIKGQLGLVELRPLRMAPNPATFSAIAALLRAIVARLMLYPFEHSLIDWGDRLHGQFALPYYLHLDLQFVLTDLAAYSLGLETVLTDLLLDDKKYEIGNVKWQGIKVRVLNALEFWPLIGDTIAPTHGDSRFIDASFTRLELSVIAEDNLNLSQWKLRINGFAAYLEPALNSATTYLAGIRYRSFIPCIGLHPKMPATDRINIILEPPDSALALKLTVFEWQPQGGAYPGLPENIAEARRRRQERLVASEIAIINLPQAKPMPVNAICNHHFDLRRI